MNSDTDILALEREIVALQREIDKPDSEVPDGKEFEALVDRQNELDLKILAVPASTAREVDAKLRRIVAWLRQDRGGFFTELANAMYGAETCTEAPETTMTNRHEDAVLFALRDECTELLDVYLKAWDEAHEARERADADPACPPVDASPAAHEAHREKHGCNEPWDRMNLSSSRIRGLSGAFFDSIANTIEGVHAKVQFALLLEQKVSEGDLDTWPYYEEWLDRIDADLSDLARVEVGAKPTGAVVSLVSEAPAGAAQDWYSLVTNLDHPIAELKCIRCTLNALSTADDLIDATGLWPIHDVLKKAIEELSTNLDKLYAVRRAEKFGAAS